MGERRQQTVLVVDDEAAGAKLMSLALEKSGFGVRVAANGIDGLKEFKASRPDAVVTDVRMPGLNGVELLEEIRRLDPLVPVLVVSGFAEVEDAVRCMQLGALDFLTKPLDLARLREAVSQALSGGNSKAPGAARDIPAPGEGLESMLGNSAAIREVQDWIRKSAPYDISVLITGESGTGKEIASRAIHHLSPRARGPMVSLDCTALPDHLIESELFGYEKGAFTGAVDRKPGRFEAANGGTLFLDEIGNLNEATQKKLLRVLEEREVTRLGGRAPTAIDVRLVTATNADLRAMVVRGEFREDLYHRLSEMEISMPPLRRRGGDVELLSAFFLRKYSHEFGRAVTGYSPEAQAAIAAHPWPGNVRELQNAVKRAVVLADTRVELAHLPPSLSAGAPEGMPGRPELVQVGPDMPPLKELTASAAGELEKKILAQALEKAGGNKSLAAKWLKTDYKTLLGKLKDHGLG